MDTKERLAFLKELIQCRYDIMFREYDGSGALIPGEEPAGLAEELFEKTGCLRCAVEADSGAPVFLSAELGLLWGAVSVGTGDERRVHVIGPVLNTVVMAEAIGESVRQIYPGLAKRHGFRDLFMSLPVVPMQMFQHYILMLTLTLTGHSPNVSDILYQTADRPARPIDQSSQKRNRSFTYMAEQELLYNVREGNMNYSDALSRSAALSTGVQIKTANPVGQAQISVIVFTSLCAREAIRGGLSPDIAHAVGDAYIQNMVEAKTISALSSLSHAMYTDFIRRVKSARTESGYSRTTRECCDYILTHMEDALSAGVLAQQLGYTPYYLSRRFKAETGMSLTQYIDSVRIEKAKVLLLSTRDSIADIAARLHYCSSTYFSEAFRRLVGVLPSEYRKNPSKYVGEAEPDGVRPPF